MLICFDTNMMIWGVRGMATPGQEGMVRRASLYLEHLKKEKHKIIIPAPVVGEYLAFYDDDDREKQRIELEQKFRVPPYDLRAAAIAARIEHDKQRVKSIQEEFGKSRQVIKVDIQIIAIAAANKADKLIANDGGLQKLADGIVTVVDIPSVETQATMFDGIE